MDVKYCIDKLGMSQKDVAHELGLSNSTVSEWISGGKQPTEKNRLKLLDLMHKQRGVAITSSMSKKYGCRWCADRRGCRCPYEKCKYADILGSYRSYNDYQKQETGDNLLRGIRL